MESTGIYWIPIWRILQGPFYDFDKPRIDQVMKAVCNFSHLLNLQILNRAFKGLTTVLIADIFLNLSGLSMKSCIFNTELFFV
jgi:hypothetical protein